MQWSARQFDVDHDIARPPEPTVVVLEPPSGHVDDVGAHPLVRPKIWRVTPIPLRQRVYDRLIPILAQDAVRQGTEPKKMFPEPPGMEAWRAKHGKKKPKKMPGK